MADPGWFVVSSVICCFVRGDSSGFSGVKIMMDFSSESCEFVVGSLFRSSVDVSIWLSVCMFVSVSVCWSVCFATIIASFFVCLL